MNVLFAATIPLVSPLASFVNMKGLTGDLVDEFAQPEIDGNAGCNVISNFDLKFSVFEFGPFDFCRIIDKLNCRIGNTRNRIIRVQLDLCTL